MMRMAREGTKRWNKEMQVETKVCERGGKKTKKKRRTHAAKAHTDNILPFQLELKVSYIIVGRWLSSFSPQFLPLFLLLLTHTRSSFWLLRTQAMHFSQFPLRLNTQRERERAAFFICHFFFRHFHFIWCAVFFLARSPFFYKTICGFSFVWENLSHIFLSLLFPLYPRASTAGSRSFCRLKLYIPLWFRVHLVFLHSISAGQFFHVTMWRYSIVFSSFQLRTCDIVVRLFDVVFSPNWINTV